MYSRDNDLSTPGFSFTINVSYHNRQLVPTVPLKRSMNTEFKFRFRAIRIIQISHGKWPLLLTKPSCCFVTIKTANVSSSETLQKVKIGTLMRKSRHS